MMLDLNGDWSITPTDSSFHFDGHVPGCIHTALLAAERIVDPYYREQEDTLLWIGETDWVYSRHFSVSPELFACQHIFLCCEGLDTFADITVNGHHIAKTDNMYRTWAFNVRDRLCVGDNTIEITFTSPLPYIRQCQQNRILYGWGGQKEIQGRAWVRKAPYHFGWDWGPTLVTCGIWRPIHLLAYDVAVLHNLHIRQHHIDGTVILDITAQVETPNAAPLSAVIAVIHNDTCLERQTIEVNRGEAHTHVIIRDPQLWWPQGLGKQPLYTINVTLFTADGTHLDTTHRRIGLRTLTLDRHADAWGESFQFVVNGHPFFAKGGNWIPADTLLPRITPAHYARLLRDVADAHMNMLRVWGGGIYEEQIFYDICDELGICVWQDFMFACAVYPAEDDVFLANVRLEATQNVQRLRHHPCIALWCGNNELECGLVGDNRDTQMSWEAYGRLFDDLLPAVVCEHDPDRTYWPSSPHKPCGTRGDADNPSSGDAHLWNVWHGRQSFEWYRTSQHRFISEFGKELR